MVLSAKVDNLHRWWIPLSAIAALFAILLFVFPFNSGDTSINAPLGVALWSVWTGTGADTDQDHSYCLLVPLMIAYSLWEKRRELASTPVDGKNSGLLWTLLGLAFFWLGARAGKQYLGFIGIQLLLWGLVVWFWGGKMSRKLLFTWAILIFAWPLPFIDTAIAFPLRMIVSTSAHHLLNLVGIANEQSGTALLSASTAAAKIGDKFQIDVADPCSGLHSLMPFLMFSSFYCYFFLEKTWQKWVVFLSTFFFAIAGNIFRITMLVIGCLLFGTPFALGTNDEPSSYHEGCGFAVFVVGLGLECLFGYALTRLDQRRSGASPAQAAVAAEAPLPAEAAAVPMWRSSTISGLAVAMLILYLITPAVNLPKEAGVVMSLPDHVQVQVPGLNGGDFYGSPAQVSEVEHRLLPKDTEYARDNYDDDRGHKIYFSIVLSGLQQYTIHPPEVCLVAQGWSIVKSDYIPITLDSGHKIVVCNLSLEHPMLDDNRQLHVVKAYYMYWYVADNLCTPSHLERNLRSSWDRIVHNRDHRWAYVIAMSLITETTQSSGGLSASATKDMLTAFIRQIVPTFQKSEIPSYTVDR